MSANKNVPVDVLASRYASSSMCEIWSQENKIRLERHFWIAVMKAQGEAGVPISQESIEAYEAVLGDIDLAHIEERERHLRHDVKARIEEFCDLAKQQHIHKGMTSRDLTDNVEQLQILQSLDLLRMKTVAVLKELSDWSDKTSGLMLVGRTHNVPAQPTTVGKRFAMFGEEIIRACSNMSHFMSTYALRGIQGAVGTQLDQSILLDDSEQLSQLSARTLHHLSESLRDLKWVKDLSVMNAVGQVYPRGLDQAALSHLCSISSGVSSFAKTVRLMAGQGLLTEGFRKGQVGSSAMPHKMNTRNSERINGFHQILNGYLTMVMGLAGDQWNEGDVSCSVVRRVALPGAMYALDGQLETALTVLQEMGVYESTIARELKQHLPFLATTRILMESVRKGSGREAAHEVIREHSVCLVQALQKGTQANNDLPERLADDPRIPLSLEDIHSILDTPEHFIGSAQQQVQDFVQQVESLLNECSEAKDYKPQPVI